MNIIEQAKQRKLQQEQEEAAKATGTIGAVGPSASSVVNPETVHAVATVSPTEAPVARTEANMNQIAPSGLATGMGSSVDGVVQHPTNIAHGTLSQSAPVSGIDRDLVPSGAYIALNLNQFTLPSGKTIKPVGGYYDPSTYGDDQEAAEAELAHFAKQYGLVEKKD